MAVANKGKNYTIRQDAIKALSEELQASSAVILVNYTGMGVVAQQELKAKLNEVGGRMKVIKNTILKLAGEDAKLPDEALTDTILSGQTAVVLGSEDAIAPLQALGTFIEANELPQLKVGAVEGTFYEKEGLLKLSKLPSKDVLSAQVIGAMMAPSYGLVGTLNANLQKLVYILQSASKGGE